MQCLDGAAGLRLVNILLVSQRQRAIHFILGQTVKRLRGKIGRCHIWLPYPKSPWVLGASPTSYPLPVVSVHLAVL